MRAGDGFFRQAGYVIVDIHEERHLTTPFSNVAARSGGAPGRMREG
jgi:hypothetical protein